MPLAGSSLGRVLALVSTLVLRFGHVLWVVGINFRVLCFGCVWLRRGVNTMPLVGSHSWFGICSLGVELFVEYFGL